MCLRRLAAWITRLFMAVHPPYLAHLDKLAALLLLLLAREVRVRVRVRVRLGLGLGLG